MDLSADPLPVAFSLQISFPILLLLAALFVGGIAVYAHLISTLAERGGKVRTDQFVLADLLVSLVLAGFFAMTITHMILRGGEAPAVKPAGTDQLLPSVTFFLALLIGLAGFLHFRGVGLVRLFGMDRMPWIQALGLATGLIIAAFPLTHAASALMQVALKETPREQELITTFREIVQKSDHASMAMILVAAIVIAPLVEEFLFRGYLYPVFKKYCGTLASGVVTTALFAAFHMNLASLPSLFVLAICFTVAYEASGSLLVPMAMHSLFNATQLLLLYQQLQGP